MTQPLLIEIGVEELPALPLLKILPQIHSSWREILKTNMLECEFDFFYTPRRLVLISKQMPIKQADGKLELVGPPLDVAIKDGKPTPAALGFAKKCGVSFENLSSTIDKNREVLFYSSTQEGQDTAKILPDMIREWIASMAFGKMMRWGSGGDEFIRPVRWLQARLGEECVSMELFGVQSSNYTFVHRMVSSEPKILEHLEDFEDTLSQGGVVLNQNKRREMILAQFDTIAKKENITIEIDDDLLDEVVAITENPKALMGSFDMIFLELPKEAIITSMKENQRYFPVFESNGELANKFIVVSNAYTSDYSQVIAGNERVLRPRLADALFFYHNDLRRGLSTQGLEKVQFIDGLGSLVDKITREERVALYFWNLYKNKFEDSNIHEETIKETIRLAKADLTTEMVYEFTELQGLMGYYYAKALGKSDEISSAIKEQYMPVGDGAPLPSSLFSSIISMSIKLDTLIGLFSVGKIPTGSKDPFALRRAANGIIRMVVGYDLSFDIDVVLEDLSQGYKSFDLEALRLFVIERIYKSIDVNPSIIKAVLASGEKDICEIYKKAYALNAIVSRDDFKNISSTFKRVANISKEATLSEVDKELFAQEEERVLFAAFEVAISKNYNSYQDKLEALFGLKKELDDYFDKVMVNTEDTTLKVNRQATVKVIYDSFKSIADIKEITI